MLCFVGNEKKSSLMDFQWFPGSSTSGVLMFAGDLTHAFDTACVQIRSGWELKKLTL